MLFEIGRKIRVYLAKGKRSHLSGRRTGMCKGPEVGRKLVSESSECKVRELESSMESCCKGWSLKNEAEPGNNHEQRQILSLFLSLPSSVQQPAGFRGYITVAVVHSDLTQ